MVEYAERDNGIEFCATFTRPEITARASHLSHFTGAPPFGDTPPIPKPHTPYLCINCDV